MEQALDPIKIKYTTDNAPTIAQFHQSNAFIRGLMGPYGSGKTSAIVWEILLKSMAQRPMNDGVRRTRWAVIRETYPQLQDTTQKTFFDWVPHEQFGTFNNQKHDYKITRFPHPDGNPMEIEIMFRALEYPKHVKNLLSLELTGAALNEGRETPMSIVNALIGRVGRYPAIKDGGPTWWGLIADTNPPDEDSWWYKIFEEMDFSAIPKELLKKIGNRDAFAQVFKQPSGLSPEAENIPNLIAGYYETLAAVNPQDWVDVYVHGKYGFVQDGRPVYPEYNDRIHTAEVHPIKDLPIIRGWDFGLSPACIFGQLLPTGQLIIFDELVSNNISLEQFADDVKLKSGRDWNGFKFEDVGDPAGAARSSLNKDLETCYDILRVKGIVCKTGEITIKIRIESVKAGLNRLRGGVPGLQVHPRCKMVRKGFLGRYQYRKMQIGEGRFQSKPDKNAYSHPHDGVQYIAAHYLGRSITQKPFDELLPKGYKTESYL